MKCCAALLSSVPMARIRSSLPADIGAVETVAGAALRIAISDEMLGGAMLVGADGANEVVVAGDILEAVEAVTGAALCKAVLDKMLRSRRFVRPDGAGQIVIGRQILEAVEAVRRAALEEAVIDEMGEPCRGVGPEGMDQITIGGDIVERSEFGAERRFARTRCRTAGFRSAASSRSHDWPG